MFRHVFVLLALAALGLAGIGFASPGQTKAAAPSPAFPAPGSMIPNSFSPLVVNGGWKDSKGKPTARRHSIVSDFGLKPVVMVFARDPRDEAVYDFLRKLDKKIEEHEDVDLAGCAVFVCFDSKRDKTDLAPENLIALANEREALVKKLLDNTQNLKHVLLGLEAPGGPKGFNIPDKTYVFVVLYDKFRVAASRNYEIGDKENKEAGFGPKAQEQLLKEVDAWTAKLKKKPGTVQKTKEQ